MEKIFKRFNQYLLFAILVVMVLHFGRTFLTPIVFAAMLAMLMAPLCRKLDSLGLHRALSSLACVLVLVLVIAGVGAIVAAQFSAFAEDIEMITQKGKQMVRQVQGYIDSRFGISPQKQDTVVKEQTTGAGKSAGIYVTRFLGGLTSAVAGMVLTFVFTFLLLFSKEKYEIFFLKVYRDKDANEVKKIVGKISHVAQQYLTGRAMSITIIATLYAIGLSLVGIKNAILLACIAALLTVVPYVGTVLGGLLPVMMALVTEDSMQPALLAVLVIFVIQTLDNYFIEPHVVGGEVNLSALTSILSIIAGGMLWGVAGMILFLPLAGIVKIICDHVESLQPIGYLIGGAKGKQSSKISEWIKSKFSKSGKYK